LAGREYFLQPSPTNNREDKNITVFLRFPVEGHNNSLYYYHALLSYFGQFLQVSVVMIIYTRLKRRYLDTNIYYYRHYLYNICIPTYLYIIYKSHHPACVYTRPTTLINQRLAWPSAVRRGPDRSLARQRRRRRSFPILINATKHVASGVIILLHILLRRYHTYISSCSSTSPRVCGSTRFLYFSSSLL